METAYSLWNARIVDGRASSANERMQVTLEDGYVREVGKASGEGPPRGGLDLEGRTVVPGLIDAHFHPETDTLYAEGFGVRKRLEGEEPRARELAYFVLANIAKALLDAGITMVRDVGSFDEDAGLVLREAIRLGLVKGPRILSCGRIISATSPGGRLFGPMYREADGPDDMRRAVREQLRRGADYIKVMATGARSVVREDPERAQMTGEELHALVDEAHRMGVRVAAHAEGLAGAQLAIQENVDTVEHGLSLHRAPELLDRMAERGIVLVPTLTTFHDIGERFADAYAPALVEQAKRQGEEVHKTLLAARDAGVIIAMGYDSGPPGTNAMELLRLIDAGLSIQEGIEAATRGSARALGVEDEVGTIEPGKVADLVIVDGDPLADVRVLTEPERIWLVIQRGNPVAGRAMAPALRPQALAAHP